MKVWTNTQFEGHWPVGVAAVVVADTRGQAAEMLNQQLTKRGLSPSATADQFDPLPTHTPLVAILRDGDY